MTTIVTQKEHTYTWRIHDISLPVPSFLIVLFLWQINKRTIILWFRKLLFIQNISKISLIIILIIEDCFVSNCWCYQMNALCKLTASYFMFRWKMVFIVMICTIRFRKGIWHGKGIAARYDLQTFPKIDK